MTHEDDLPAEVRRQDEEAELQVAAQLAKLHPGTETAHEDDLPAEVRRQDEEAELQVAAQLAELRKDEDVLATRGWWSDLSKRTQTLLATAAVADGALRVAALIDIWHRRRSAVPKYSNQTDLHLALADLFHGSDLPERPSPTSMRLVCIEKVRERRIAPLLSRTGHGRSTARLTPRGSQHERSAHESGAASSISRGVISRAPIAKPCKFAVVAAAT